MATASGQLQLNDYDAELLSRGFDGLDQPSRFRIINFAYQRIAAHFTWLWEKVTVDVVINPGTYALNFTADLPNFRSLDYLYVVTQNFEKRLRRIDDDQFYQYWLSQDLTAARNRGEPAWYKIEDNQIYIIPPPVSQRTLRAHYHRRISPLTNVTPGVTDTPLTPQHLDEAIVLGMVSGAHKRVHELQLAAQAEADLGEWIDQMSVDEEWEDEQAQDRVEPDNTWL